MGDPQLSALRLSIPFLNTETKHTHTHTPDARMPTKPHMDVCIPIHAPKLANFIPEDRLASSTISVLV